MNDISIYVTEDSKLAGVPDPDPVTTEIMRNSLNSAANQMKDALVRTSFSPVIYEVLDFAAALYDRDIRLLAQAPSLPAFMGTLNFCVHEAVEGVGGVANLEPGDIILYNWPYGTGSHPQDAALIMPAFLENGELVGYAAIKAHWLDIGGKAPYSTDTTDVFQEGTIFPGIKLYSRGRPVDDIYRMVLANSRLPKMVEGDINAQVTGVRAGVAGLVRVIERFGTDAFDTAVEHMFNHGEAVVRSYFEKIPDGRYVGHGRLDNNGIDDDFIEWEIIVTIAGSDIEIDFSTAPDAVRGPSNTPLPSTVSASRIAISMLAGGCEAPTEGHFRPIKIITRPGSMFHPKPPSPCFMYGWLCSQSIEVIYHAISKAVPEIVPACSGGSICGLAWWGTRQETGEPWADGTPHPVGQGGHAKDDGGTLIHVAQAVTRFSPVEVWETRNPFLLQKVELAPDSCGPGKFRGGLGVDFFYEMLEDSYFTSILERTKTKPWGLAGGKEGRASRAVARLGDGSRETCNKTTGFKLRKGEVLEIYCGGGGGYGPPSERSMEAVHGDIREGYTSEEFARKHYPQAF